MNRLLDLIGSRRFAVWILVVTTAVILISNLLPKPYIMTVSEMQALKRESPAIFYLCQRFNVARVTKSPYFIAVTAFLFASITVCTARRVRRRLERESAIPEVSTLSVKHEIDGVDTACLMGILSRRRWSWTERGFDGGRVIYSRKGEHGFWGSVAFHTGMCVILTGALFSALTRYNGSLVLTEGFDVDPARVLSGLSRDEVYVFPVRRMVLDSFRPVYRGAFPIDYSGRIVSQDAYGRVYPETVRVNEPMRAGGYQFMMSRYGFAPGFLLRDSAGKVISDDVINLVVIKPDMVDTFRLLDGMATVKVRFFPDFYVDTEKGIPATRSRLPNNPVFLVTIERLGREKEGGFLKMGESLEFDGYTLEFKDIRYWVQMEVSRDSGIPLITAGFFVIVLGLTLRLLLNEKAVWVIITEQKIRIGGRARFFPALFEEELRRLAEEITQDSGFRSQGLGE